MSRSPGICTTPPRPIPTSSRLAGHPELSIACFRYVPRELRGQRSAEPYLNLLNERLMSELQLGGRVFPSNAVVNGHFALRACIVNFRTEAADINALIEHAVDKGALLHARGAGRTETLVAPT